MTAVLPISAEPTAIPQEEVRRGRWRRFASDCGLTQRQLDRMATAFEHDDAEAARAL